MSSPAPASASRADLLGAIARIGAVVLAVLLSFSALDSLQVAITRCTAAAAVALIVALALGTAGHLALGLSARIGERARRHLAAHGHGALAAATAYLVLRPWNFYSDRHHSALVVPVLTWLGVVSLRSACGCSASMPTSPARHSQRCCSSHAMRSCCLACIARSTALRPALGRTRPLRTLTLLAAAVPLALAWRDNGLPREVGARHGLVLPRLVALIAPLVDRDADGFSPLFTRDCDDGDPGVHPGACEVANGRDDNCNGHTDVAPRYRPDEGSGTRPPGPPPDVYLIVVDALRADFARQERRRAMPALDRFAAQALDFEHAYTPYPSTHRAMLALSTSRPHRFRSTAVPPLPRFLHDAGYDAQV